MTGISHRSAITVFGKIRRRIAEECERQSPFRNGEVDESYFGPQRVRGKRGRGAGRKTIVFGLLKRVGYAKHFRVHHWADEFANGETHINGIECFWSFAKRRLQK